MMKELYGKTDQVYKALEELKITPLIALYDEVLISDEDYSKHKNQLALRGII